MVVISKLLSGTCSANSFRHELELLVVLLVGSGHYHLLRTQHIKYVVGHGGELFFVEMFEYLDHCDQLDCLQEATVRHGRLQGEGYVLS